MIAVGTVQRPFAVITDWDSTVCADTDAVVSTLEKLIQEYDSNLVEYTTEVIDKSTRRRSKIIRLTVREFVEKYGVTIYGFEV